MCNFVGNFILSKMNCWQHVSKILMWGTFVSMAWIMLSCEEFCEESNRTAMAVNFYKVDDDSKTSSFSKMTIKAIDNDTLLYLGASLSSALCPLNPAADVTGYVFMNDTVGIDTVIIRYTRHNGFISSECGCAVFAEITDVETTNHAVREVRLTNPSVTTVSYRQGVINAENIRIYY